MKKNRVAIILDRSGSMKPLTEEVISVFNKQIETLKANSLEMDTKVSLITFSTVADVPTLWNQDVAALKLLTAEDYKPEGMTAMYDAVGRTLTNLITIPEANDPETSFLIVVISDGAENNSKEYAADRIASMVKEVQATNRWTFTYLGANQDLSQVSKTLNIPLSNTMSFAASSAGVRGMGQSWSAGTQAFYTARKNGATASTNFFDQDAQNKATQNPKPDGSIDTADIHTLTTTNKQ